MTDFVAVCKLSELKEAGKKTVVVDDQILVVFFRDGKVYCLDDVCTHDGGPLGEGVFEDHSIACPRHGACFDIRTGKPLTMPATEATVRHDAMIQDEEVWVRLNQPA